MPAGVLKWFDPARGRGSLTLETGGDDIFVKLSPTETAKAHGFRQGERVLCDLGVCEGLGRAVATALRAPRRRPGEQKANPAF